MDRAGKITSLPLSDEVEIVEDGVTYGIAYMTHIIPEWATAVGSAAFVIGCYTTITSLVERHEEILFENTDTDANVNTFVNTLIYRLDDNGEPVKLINKMCFNPEQAKLIGHEGSSHHNTANVILCDISKLGNENVEPFEMEF